MKMTVTLLLGAALSVAACSGAGDTNAAQSEKTPEPAETVDEAMTQPEQKTEATVANSDKGTHPGGDAIELAGLASGDIPELDGELGCSFAIPESKNSVLIAKGDVDPKASVFGIYKVGDSVERIGGGPGGYDKLANGMKLSGKGMTLDIVRTSTKSNATGHEGVAYPATLTLNRADGGKRVYTGTWNCGP